MGRGKSRKSLELLDAAHNVLSEIQPAGIRAVCYRLFTMGLIANMSKNETNKVSAQLTWAREAGVIPWDWIVDETREAERIRAFDNPGEYVEAVKRSYRRNRWTDQPAWLEVWSEKGTIRGTLAPVLHDYGVTFRVMHGYGSATAVQQVARETMTTSKTLVALYVGDWDPSGLHMSEEDLPRRLEKYGGRVVVQRLALDVEDVAFGDLPSFDVQTKYRDPRYAWYTERFPAGLCWELDALSPTVLRRRVEQAILERLDLEAWHRAEITEAAECESLTSILDAWPGISRQAQKYADGAPR
jgi:hypothetical protein